MGITWAKISLAQNENSSHNIVQHLKQRRNLFAYARHVLSISRLSLISFAMMAWAKSWFCENVPLMLSLLLFAREKNPSPAHWTGDSPI